MRVVLAAAGAVAALVAGAAPAGATDLYALTTDDRIVRFDPATPAVAKATLPAPAGARAITSYQRMLFVVDSAGRIQRVNQATGAVERTVGPYPMPPGTHVSLSVRWPPAVRIIGSGDGYTDIPELNYYATTGPTPPELEILGAAVETEPNGLLTVTDEYVVDGASDQLLREDAGAYEPVGPLGVPVAGPAGFEIVDGVGRLAAGGGLRTVDLATGEAGAAHPLGFGVRDLAVVHPPLVHVGEPQTLVPFGPSFTEGDVSRVDLVRVGDPFPRIDVTLGYATAGPDRCCVSRAEAGADFDPTERRYTFEPGVTSIPLPNPLIDDDLVEGLETFDHILNGERRMGGFLNDNGDAEFAATTIAVDESAGRAELEVRRKDDPQHATPASVDVGTIDGGTATSGTDYSAARQRLDFAPGETSKRVAVPIVDDGTTEQDETVRVGLLAPTGRVLDNGRSTASITIRNDDTAGDRTQPRLSSLPKRLKLRKVIRVRFRCSEACAAKVALKLDRKTARRLRVRRKLAAGTARLPKAGKGTAKLKVRKATLRKLRRAKRVRATLTVRAADAAGNRARAKRKLSLRR